MVAVLKDFQESRAHRPMQGIVLGALMGVLLWTALLLIVVAL